MGIPLESITALIGATPGIRLVELADELEIDAAMVERALAPALDDGSVLAVSVPTLGGKLMASYSLKACATQPSAPVVPATTTEAVAPEPEPAAGAVVEVSPMADGSRKQRKAAARARREAKDSQAKHALEFILAQPGRRASNEALRKQLNLPKGKYASNYFRRYIEDGSLVRVRDGWAATPLDAGGRAQDGVSEHARAAAIDWENRQRSTMPSIAPAAARYDASELSDSAPAPAVNELRYALWSDGMLELRRGGQTLALLTVAERIALRAFLSVGAPA